METTTKTAEIDRMPYAPWVLVLLLTLVLGGCGGDREALAIQISSSAGLVSHEISATPFTLMSFERIEGRGGSANIYIEGDGEAWQSRRTPSLDPTPSDPVALRLASRDPAANVVYIARPCQYRGMSDEQAVCPKDYWMGKRFAPEVIQSYSLALDDIVRRHGVSGFHLVGFSGGASIAALVATQRSDVLSLRTIAGNLDPKAHSAYHNVSMLSGSLNPIDFPDVLASIPQRHFIGAEDTIVPPEVFQSYANALSTDRCLRSHIVEGTTHTGGWEEQWLSLLAEPVNCSQVVEP